MGGGGGGVLAPHFGGCPQAVCLCRNIAVSNLLYVKEDYIIPHGGEPAKFC